MGCKSSFLRHGSGGFSTTKWFIFSVLLVFPASGRVNWKLDFLIYKTWNLTWQVNSILVEQMKCTNRKFINRDKSMKGTMYHVRHMHFSVDAMPSSIFSFLMLIYCSLLLVHFHKNFLLLLPVIFPLIEILMASCMMANINEWINLSATLHNSAQRWQGKVIPFVLKGEANEDVQLNLFSLS